MALVTFLNTEQLTLATRKLVYEPDEISSLTSVIEQANLLQEIFATESDKVDAAVKEGHEAGYEKGQEEGYEAALEHIAVKLIMLAKEANATRESIEESAGNIAIKIVEKITSDIGSKETVLALAKSAASEFVPGESIVLRVHPDNQPYIHEKLLESEQPASRFVEVVGDPVLSLDDCVLETEYGQIKADLKTQLKVIREKMYGT